MQYQKYKCDSCKRDYHTPENISTSWVCPNSECNSKELTKGRTVSRIPGLSSIELTQSISERPKRITDLVNYDEGDDPEANRDKKRKKPNDDDNEWFPPSRIFNLAMRYTTGTTLYTARSEYPETPDEHLMVSEYSDIKYSPGVPRNTAKVMGDKLKNGIKLSAQEHSGRGVPYKENSKRSEEWCHLRADSHGGHTIAENLVAASYSANTFMAVIESQVQNNNKVQSKITAHCSRPHVAEKITYELRAKPDPNANNRTVKKSFEIDATCQNFTEADATRITTQIKTWLKANNLLMNN